MFNLISSPEKYARYELSFEVKWWPTKLLNARAFLLILFIPIHQRVLSVWWDFFVSTKNKLGFHKKCAFFFCKPSKKISILVSIAFCFKIIMREIRRRSRFSQMVELISHFLWIEINIYLLFNETTMLAKEPMTKIEMGGVEGGGRVRSRE